MGANVPLLEIHHERKYYQQDSASVMLSDTRRGPLLPQETCDAARATDSHSLTITPACLSGLSGFLWGMS
jgi:hypothetical protein